MSTKLSAASQEETGGAYTAAAVSFATHLLENTNDLVAAVDADRRFVALNAAFRREFELVFGRAPELGQRLDDILQHVTGDRETVKRLTQRAFGGESFRVVEEFGDENLLRKTYELALSPILDTRGRTLMVGIVVRDLSAQRASERQFGALLEAAPDAMIIIRADGAIALANQQAERLFGVPRERLLGQPVEILLPERFRRIHVAQRQHFDQHPQARPMGSGRSDLVGLRADGSEFPVEISLNPLLLGGEALVVAAIRDVSARKAVEDELRRLSSELEARVAERTAQLEEANRRLSARVEAHRLTEAQLAASAMDFQVIFEQAAVGMARQSLDGRWERVNETLCQITGYAADELIGRHFLDLTYADDIEAGRAEADRVRRGETDTATFEKRYVHRDGRVIWVRMTLSSARDAAATPLYLIAVIEDITQSKWADQAQLEMESRLQLAVDIAGLGLFEWNIVTNQVYLSPEFKQQLGYADEEMPNRFQEWERRLHPDDHRVVMAAIERLLQGVDPSYEVEFRMRHRSGGYRWIIARAILVTDIRDHQRKMIGIHFDITERKQAEDRLRQAALHDPLTDLPNRALLFEYAAHVLAGAKRSRHQAGAVFIDLDRFKPINDRHGHEVGDQILQEVSRRLKDCTREEDVVFRLGGDEFLVLLSRLESADNAATVAANVASCLNRPYTVGELELTLSPSIGISIYPQDGDNIDTLINHADIAMYHAKHLGRNNVQFYVPELAERANLQASIEQRLKFALVHEEFRLYYQPVVDMHTQAVVGVEALLRWPHKNIGPDRFVPVAESTGLIGRLSDWVICEACRQHSCWRAAGLPPIPVAINVSAVQFRNKDFAHHFSEAICGNGIDPSALQLELTETALMEDIDYAIETLALFRSQGIKISLDDFGTGYSSLSYLSRLPLDKIKLDKSFVHRLENDKASRAVTEAVIALGRTLDLEIVAEGIESAQVLYYLLEQGCDQAQGFHVCRPLSGGDFADWYRRHGAA